jgi:NADPH:quinone reductase-like Zn-dependent oxidoreductase
VRREEAAEQVQQWGGDRVVLQGDNLHKDIEEALGGKTLRLVLETVGGTPVGELATSLNAGGSIVGYATQSGQFPVFPRDFFFRGLSFHGFWLINWLRHAPRTEIQEMLVHRETGHQGIPQEVIQAKKLVGETMLINHMVLGPQDRIVV